jgi:hypothetical protein
MQVLMDARRYLRAYAKISQRLMHDDRPPCLCDRLDDRCPIEWRYSSQIDQFHANALFRNLGRRFGTVVDCAAVTDERHIFSATHHVGLLQRDALSSFRCRPSRPVGGQVFNEQARIIIIDA